MNPITAADLWQQLRATGLVEGDMPEHYQMESPWYVRTMLGISGWLGALFLLGFVGAGMMFILENAAAGLVAGVICCWAAMIIFRSNLQNDFAGQFSLAISLAGQGIFVVGLFQLFDNVNSTLWLLIALFEAVLVVIMQSRLHRLWSTWATITALFFAFAEFGIYNLLGGLVALVMTYIWLNEFRLAHRSRILKPVAYGLTINLIQFNASPFLYTHLGLGTTHGEPVAPQFFYWLDIALMSTVFIATVWLLLKRENLEPFSYTGRAAILAAFIAIVISFYAPGLSVGLLIILLGFANGNRVLLGIGLVSLASYLGWYYYSLHTTLLNKSIILVITGIVLIVLRRLLLYYFRPPGAEHA